VDSRIKTYLPS